MGNAFPANNILSDIILLSLAKIRERIETGTWQAGADEICRVDIVIFEEMLKELQDKGYFLAMATSKPEAFADIVLRHFHIRDYIKVMAGATMDEGRTNKAEVLAYALEQMNISDLSEAVMVGDRSYDVKGAQAMGIDSVGVLYGYGSREELEEAGATKIAQSVEDLKNILLNWK